MISPDHAENGDGASNATPYVHPLRISQSPADSNGIQSTVRAFFSSTAFTPYGVREWKRSNQISNPNQRLDSRGGCTSGFRMGVGRPTSSPARPNAQEEEGFAHANATTNMNFALPPILPTRVPSAPVPRLPRMQRPVTSDSTARGYTHYRKIEDLSRFLRGDGTDADTYYFKDAMERRLEREAESQSAACYGKQEVFSMDHSDPRFRLRADNDASDAQRRAKLLALPPRITQFHAKFLETTALVRPYALGESHVNSAKARPSPHDFETGRKALDTFVLTMQCQRPTKGIAAPY